MMKFRQRDGDLFVLPPFDVDMSDVFVFLLGANRAKLQDVCANDLNVGPERFEPLGDFVILYGATIDNLSRGTRTRASEMGLWIPVATKRHDETQLFTYTPYVWLGSSTSTRVGRTLYGYPKQEAGVRVPSDGDELSLEVIGDALVALSQPNTYETRRTSLIRARPRAPAIWKRPPTHGLRHWLDLLALVVELAKDLVALPNVSLGDLLQLARGQRSVFLRQLPGVAAFDPPSYQALLEAAIVPRANTVSGARLEEAGWEIAFPSYREPKIVETLGLSGEQTGDGSFVAQPRGVAWMQFAGTLEAAREIWRGA